MILDLRDIPSRLINLDRDTEKLRLSEERLGSLGIHFERFSGILHERNIVGCGKSHLSVISQIKAKTLVFEDDIVATDHFEPIIDVPDEADALYLGISKWGYWPDQIISHEGGALPKVALSRYSPEFIRTHNMCAAHAIVYLSQRFIEATIKIAEECLSRNIPWDLGLASIHSQFIVLTPNFPMFYQEDQPESTNIVFNE